MEYKIVKFHRIHISTLVEICNRVNKFPCPDITDASIVVRSSIQNEQGEIVAGGFIKLIPEAIVIVEPNLSAQDRIDIIKLFFENARKAVARKKFTEIHAFVKDKSFVNFLKKRLGFHKVNGEALSITLSLTN